MDRGLNFAITLRWVMPNHPPEGYDHENSTITEDMMEKYLEMWLNPINLGILFLCITGGIWLLAHCAPNYKDR